MMESGGAEPLDCRSNMSKSDNLRIIISEKLTAAAWEILAVVERTLADYEEEASGFRQEIERQKKLLELLQPEVKVETSDDQQLFPPCEAEGGEPPEEEEQHKYEPGVEDSWSLGILCYTEEEEEEESSERPALSSTFHFTEPDYDVASRFFPPTAQSVKRKPGRPRIGELSSLVDLKIRILEDPTIDVLSVSVFQKYPVHELQCPRDLQETDFLDLLRSTFPQLAAHEAFDVFTTDRSRKLQPLRVASLTPEEIYSAIRSTGNSALYVRLKAREKESLQRKDPPSTSDPTALNTRVQSKKRKVGRPRIRESETRVDLRIRILEDSQIDVMSPSVFQKYPVHELQCPRDLQEADFVHLLRSTFPQLAADEHFTVLRSQRRKLKPLQLESLTPEEICRTIRSTGNPLVYIRLTPPVGLQAGERKSLQRRDAAAKSPPTTVENTKVQLERKMVGRLRSRETATQVHLRIRILEDSQIDVMSPSVFQMYPVHQLQCPRGLKESDFLVLLRSTFPQLAADKPFDVFTIDRIKRLQPIKVKTLTPEKIYRAIRSAGSSAVFIRLKAQAEVQASPKQLLQQREVDPAEDSPSFSDPTRLDTNGPFEQGANVVSETSASHHEDVETQEADDGREGSESVRLWPQVLSESSQMTDGGDDWKPLSSDEHLRNVESEKMAGKQQVKRSGVVKAKKTKQIQPSPHVLTDNGNAVLACRVCKILRGSMNMLIRHAWSHVGERERLCGVCGRQSVSAKELRSHLETHQKTHRCNICGKSFLTVHGFKGHMDRHDGKRPYKCKICHKGFTEKSVLRNHEWIHVTDKPYKCDVCPKSYVSKLELKVHQSTHSNRKLYSCNRCGNRFRSLEALSGHLVLHSNRAAVTEKRCICKICGKKFSTERKLRMHVTCHSNKGPYACSKCNKRFLFKSTLDVHMRVHTGEKPYKCSICGAAFSQQHCVKRHMATHQVEESSAVNGSDY